jgi:hypothetical protein
LLLINGEKLSEKTYMMQTKRKINYYNTIKNIVLTRM